MIHAYQEMYMPKAQSVLGDAFDYAVNVCGMHGADFVKLFTASTISRRMENGEPALLVGKSGTEIVLDVVLETTGKSLDPVPLDKFKRSREYWIGWAVAYYQWHADRSYRDIFKALSFDDLQHMYYTLHEADISKFKDIADERIRERFKDTNLKRIRTACGHSQSALAKKSGTSLRSIQMYEQRRKEINKASAETLYRIAKVLGCTIEDLLEA